MNRYTRPVRLALAILALLAPRGGRADTRYTIQPIVKVGDKAGDVTISGFLQVGALNDSGQLIFNTELTSGSTEVKDELFQYADGNVTPIIVAGGAAPTGTWPSRVGLWVLVSMNQRGDAVVHVLDLGRDRSLGIFVWDRQAQKLTPVVVPGMPAVPGTTFADDLGPRPVINNRGEIVFAAEVKSADGKTKEPGIFLRSPDGQFSAVAVPDQALPGSGQIRSGWFPTLSDNDRVGFLVVPRGKSWPTTQGYLWENGALTLVAATGTEAPGGEKFLHIDGVWVNSKNQSVLVSAVLHNLSTGPRNLYRFADGKLLSVVVAGQEMPGGGTFKTSRWQLSFPNDAGQHAFAAQIVDAGVTRTAAYLLDADGKLSLILKSGMTSELGRVTNVGWIGDDTFGIGLNNKGQVALPVQIDGAPDTIVLLTPTTP